MSIDQDLVRGIEAGRRVGWAKAYANERRLIDALGCMLLALDELAHAGHELLSDGTPTVRFANLLLDSVDKSVYDRAQDVRADLVTQHRAWRSSRPTAPTPEIGKSPC